MSGTGHHHEHGPEIHGGSRTALGWSVLDAIVIATTIAIIGIIAEYGWRVWKARRAAEGVRYDLTPEARAALALHNGVPAAPQGAQTAAEPADVHDT